MSRWLLLCTGGWKGGWWVGLEIDPLSVFEIDFVFLALSTRVSRHRVGAASNWVIGIERLQEV